MRAAWTPQQQFWPWPALPTRHRKFDFSRQVSLSYYIKRCEMCGLGQTHRYIEINAYLSALMYVYATLLMSKFLLVTPWTFSMNELNA